MAGLPKKYAKMGFKRGWKAYRASKGKATKTSKKRSSPRRAKPMVRRRARRALKRAIRHRTNTIPVVDVLHGVYTVDGMTKNQTSLAIKQATNALFVPGSASTLDYAAGTFVEGVKGAMDDPKKAITGGVKNFATVYLFRKALGWIGIPKSVKFFGKTRIQVR